MLSFEQIREQVHQFLSDTMEARILSERCRDYYDGKQWTQSEISKLAARRQAPIVSNRIKPKVNGLVGLYSLRKTDPKGFPRTQKHEDSAHAVSDALRFVADNVGFDIEKETCAEEFFVEGYCGVMIGAKQKRRNEVEITIEHIPWDRLYYDPHSRKKDFSDVRYNGIIMWLSVEELNEKVPGANAENLLDAISDTDETFEDRPRWMDTSRNRVRVALHFFLHEAKWRMCMLSGSGFVIKPQLSPFLDEDGEPSNPIEMVSAYVDRDNARYGEVKDFLDQQDEINHKRSKIQHFGSSRQTFSRRGVITDIAAFKREMAKPDGHWETNDGEKFGDDFGVLPSGDMSKVQFELYQEAKTEIERSSYSGQLAGGEQQGTLSGVAVARLQQADTIELNHLYSLLAGWEKRVYRQAWARVRQFWTEEKWIRVTDDQDSLRWAGFNYKVTLQERLEEVINDEAAPLETRQQAAQIFMQMMQTQDPRLQEIIEVKNDVAELDIDVIVEQSFDVVNTQEEQLKLLAGFGADSGVDVLELIELSNLRGKDELIEKIEKRRQQAAEAAGNVAQMEAQGLELDNVKKSKEAALIEQKAISEMAQTEILINEPARVTNVSV